MGRANLCAILVGVLMLPACGEPIMSAQAERADSVAGSHFAAIQMRFAETTRRRAVLRSRIERIGSLQSLAKAGFPPAVRLKRFYDYLVRTDSTLERMRRPGGSASMGMLTASAGYGDWQYDSEGYLNFDSEGELYAFMDEHAQIEDEGTFAFAGFAQEVPSQIEAWTLIRHFPFLANIKNDVSWEYTLNGGNAVGRTTEDEGPIGGIPFPALTTSITYPDLPLDCEIHHGPTSKVRAWTTHYAKYPIGFIKVKVAGIPFQLPQAFLNRPPRYTGPSSDHCQPVEPPPPGFEIPAPEPWQPTCYATPWGLFVWFDDEWVLVYWWLEFDDCPIYES